MNHPGDTQPDDRLNRTFEDAPICIFQSTMEGRLLRINSAGARMFGYATPEEAIESVAGSSETVFVHPERRRQMLQSAIGSEGFIRAENEYRRRDGSTFTGSIHIRAVRKEGRVEYLEGFLEDITEQCLAQREIQDRQARLDSIVRAAPVGIGVVVNRVLTEANDLVCEMTGYSRGELIGRSARMLYPAQEDYDLVGKAKYAQIAARGTGTVETRMMRKDGSIFDVLLSSTPIDLGDLSHGVTFTILDISERKRAEAEKQAFYRQTILSVTDGRLQICDIDEVHAYLSDACVNISVDDAQSVAEARKTVEAEGIRAGLSEGRARDFVIAAGEAITNAIKHGTSARVCIGTSHSAIWIGVTDAGPGIDSLILPKAILRRGFSTKPSLGLGYSMMLEMADQVLLSTGPSGTTVVLVKDILEQAPVSIRNLVDTWEGISTD